MPLYCYIIETGYYEDKEANILGHPTKYSQEEFNKICIEITEKYGDVEEIEYFSAYDKTDVEEIRYKIDAEELMDHLINEYGFIELDIPVNDGVQHIEVSRKPVPPENLRKVTIKHHKCSFEDRIFFTKEEGPQFNARCDIIPEKEMTCSSPDSDYNMVKPLFKKIEKDQ